jgi:oxaloacetate decarboxylase (Na+ extruding) subunit gamma
MPTELTSGLLLMAAGMATVFIALGLVAGIGHALILIVNRFAPPPPVPVYPESEGLPAMAPSGEGPNAAKLAAILAAVEAVTGGRGKVTSITKTNSHP